MTKWIALCAVLGMLAVGGCKASASADSDPSNEPKKMSTDACPHCPGNQTATADGKCPVCGAKVARR